MSVLETFKDDESTYEKLLAIIFEISGNNKFFSVIYSKLHTHIQQNTTNRVLYTSKLENFVENYKASYQTIQYVDQNDDYDKFCEYNKSNDLRKSKALFCMNLTKQNLLTVTEFTTIVLDIIDKLMNYLITDAINLLFNIENTIINRSDHQLAEKNINSHFWYELIH